MSNFDNMLLFKQASTQECLIKGTSFQYLFREMHEEFNNEIACISQFFFVVEIVFLR